MKKIGLIAAAATLAAAGAAFGQGSVNLELQSVSPAADFSNVYGTEASWDGNGTFSITLMVRAQILGDATATGLTTFDGALSDDGSGSFAAAVLSNFDAIGVPGIAGNDFQNRTGVTPDYRATIGGPEGNLTPGNGLLSGSSWTFLPLAITPTGVDDAVAGLDDIYRVTWTTSDPTARTVVLTVGAAGAGYQSSGGLVTTSNVDGGSFTINIVPAPGAFALMGLGGLVAIRRRR